MCRARLQGQAIPASEEQWNEKADEALNRLLMAFKARFNYAEELIREVLRVSLAAV